jgi:hypothetical protein
MKSYSFIDGFFTTDHFNGGFPSGDSDDDFLTMYNHDERPPKKSKSLKEKRKEAKTVSQKTEESSVGSVVTTDEKEDDFL